MLTYKTEISAAEVNYLRASIGFRQIHPEQVEAGLQGSSLVIAVFDGSCIIGMGRLIWDGGIVAMVNDLIVIPEYRSQNIEDEILNHIIEFLKSKLKTGFGIQVDIKAWTEQREICEKLGFQLSTTERRGVPMHICLTNQIELTDKMFRQMEYRES